ncbi:interstitial collagenase-like [Antedon mediterranea]|uniref:interstitial collagenase-like n=1 Tax=Antedon mediterranea TaxID=105859 RepID=UPI003AF5B5F2
MYYTDSSRALLGLLVMTLISGFSAAPVNNQLRQAERFFMKCGYLATVAEEDQHYNDDFIISALARFQMTVGLPATGTFTEETFVRMENMECNNEGKRRRRSSIPVTHRWSSNEITWDIASYSKWLKNSQVDATTEQALQMWSDAADLTFKRMRGESNVDIKISFVEGVHEDNIDFGGRNRAVAHAFYPPSSSSNSIPLSGDVHLYDGVVWTVNSATGNSLMVHLLHEIGHSIGIEHSSNMNDVMHNPPPAYHSDIQLSENDKEAARELYGAPTENPEFPGNPIAPPEVVNLPVVTQAPPPDCIESFDAATQMLTGEIIFTRGNNMWKIGLDDILNNNIIKDPPVPNSSIFPGLPGDIDSAMTVPDRVEWRSIAGKTYFFKGNQVWRYTGYSLDTGYPSTIKQEFNMDYPMIDAAFSLGDTLGLYFITGDQYRLQTPYIYIENLPTNSFTGFTTNAAAAINVLIDGHDVMYLFGKDGNHYKIMPPNWSVISSSSTNLPCNN